METPINYESKYGLSEALAERLYPVVERFVDGVGTWVVLGDQALADEVNDFIAAYSGVDKLKTETIKTLQVLGVEKLNDVYGGDEVFSNVGEVKLLLDIDATYTRDGSPAARLVQVGQVLNKFTAKRNEVNALSTEAELLAYDVEAGW